MTSDADRDVERRAAEHPVCAVLHKPVDFDREVEKTLVGVARRPQVERLRLQEHGRAVGIAREVADLQTQPVRSAAREWDRGWWPALRSMRRCGPGSL